MVSVEFDQEPKEQVPESPFVEAGRHSLAWLGTPGKVFLGVLAVLGLTLFLYKNISFMPTNEPWLEKAHAKLWDRALEMQRPHLYHDILSKSPSDIQRLADMLMIKEALDNYYRDHSSYPVTSAHWGEPWSKNKNWIPGLVPDYLKYLPRDPREKENGLVQYRYESDGKDFKLIAHAPEKCKSIRKIAPELIDPLRNCWSFGFWTDGSKNK